MLIEQSQSLYEATMKRDYKNDDRIIRKNILFCINQSSVWGPICRSPSRWGTHCCLSFGTTNSSTSSRSMSSSRLKRYSRSSRTPTTQALSTSSTRRRNDELEWVIRSQYATKQLEDIQATRFEHCDCLHLHERPHELPTLHAADRRGFLQHHKAEDAQPTRRDLPLPQVDVNARRFLHSVVRRHNTEHDNAVPSSVTKHTSCRDASFARVRAEGELHVRHGSLLGHLRPVPKISYERDTYLMLMITVMAIFCASNPTTFIGLCSERIRGNSRCSRSSRGSAALRSSRSSSSHRWSSRSP